MLELERTRLPLVVVLNPIAYSACKRGGGWLDDGRDCSAGCDAIFPMS